MLDEAEYQFRCALNEARKLSVVDPEITEVLRQLAILGLERGRAEEALTFSKEAYGIDESYWFGPSAQSCQDLLLMAGAQDQLGLNQDAVETCFRALPKYEQFYGAAHAETSALLAKLFLYLLDGGDSPRLDAVAVRVLEHFLRIAPPGTLTNSIGIDQRLQLFLSSNKEQQAEQLFKRASTVLRKHLGDHNRETVVLQKSYANMLSSTNKQLTAWRLKATAETQIRKDDLQRRAEDLILHSRYAEAEPLLRRHLSFMQMQYGPAHPATLQVRKRYAWLQRRIESAVGQKVEVRERVLEVVSRMAANGGAWKAACADAMQIHKIGNAEVEQQIQQWRALDVHVESLNRSDGPLTPGYAVRGAATAWPTPQDYNEAVQNPAVCFFDTELKTGQPELNLLGLPVVASGAFASVYKFNCTGAARAVRFFLSPVKDREYRYQQLSDYICSDDLIYTVNFEYQQNGVKHASSELPLLKMEWVEGIALNTYIDQVLLEPGELEKLLHLFRVMTQALRDAGVAHGDLQHGNILVRDGEFVLVDYDGMFVPALRGHASNELGHPNYQHPARNASHFGAYLDAFAAWVIDTSLFALTVDPELWYRLKGGDECILLRRKDLLDPERSQTMHTLLSHPCEELRQRVRFLLSLRALPVEQLPTVSVTGDPVACL